VALCGELAARAGRTSAAKSRPGSPVASLVYVTSLPAWVSRRCLDVRAAATGPGAAPARSVTGPTTAKEAGTPVGPPTASTGTSASPMPGSTSASTAPAWSATKTWCAHPAAMNGRSFTAARSIRRSAGPATSRARRSPCAPHESGPHRFLSAGPHPLAHLRMRRNSFDACSLSMAGCWLSARERSR
jgi:hypothetical protein